MNGFFGPLKPYTGAYHPSVYRKYARGGGNALGTLGHAFAYKRPTQLSDGGTADDGSDYGDPIDQIDAVISQQQQLKRQPSMGEQYLKFEQEWGGDSEGVSQRFASGSPYDISRASGDLAQLDEDSRENIQDDAAKFQDKVEKELEGADTRSFARGGNAFTKAWATINKIKRKYGGNVSQQLADRYKRQEIGSNGINPGPMPDYDESTKPQNGPDNDSHQGYIKGYHGDQMLLKSRKGSEGTGFARGGSTVKQNPYATPAADGMPPSIAVKHRAPTRVTAAWENRPVGIKQRNSVGKGLHVGAPHSGEGLVLNVYLSPVGPNAISLTHTGSGGVNVARMADRSLQGDARPMPAGNPFHQGPAPTAIPTGPQGFASLLGQMPYGAGPVRKPRASR
jgi:hypothetical protein